MEQRGIIVKNFSVESGILVTGDDYVEVGFFIVSLDDQVKLTSTLDSWGNKWLALRLWQATCQAQAYFYFFEEMEL